MQMANKKKVVFKKTTLSKRVLTNTSILLIRGQIFLEVIIVLVKLQENNIFSLPVSPDICVYIYIYI